MDKIIVTPNTQYYVSLRQSNLFRESHSEIKRDST